MVDDTSACPREICEYESRALRIVLMNRIITICVENDVSSTCEMLTSEDSSKIQDFIGLETIWRHAIILEAARLQLDYYIASL